MILTRLKNYIFRSCQFAQLIKPAYVAPFFFASRHIVPKFLFGLRYKKSKFYARNIDYSAIREVLIEGEYDFLTPFLEKREPIAILDVGAHIGLFALWALKENPEATILSVEASPDTYKILNKTRDAAVRSQTYKWQAIHRAAWKDNSTISFSSQGDAMSHQVSQSGTSKIEGIDMNTLLDIFGHDRIDLMKVDIEGAEEAFLCAEPHMLNKVNSLVIELHSKYCDTDRVRKLLEEYFPNIKTISGRTSSKSVLYCTRDKE